MNDKTKIIIAAVCILVAGVLAAFQLGAFSGGGAKGVKSTDSYADDENANGQGVEFNHTDGGVISVDLSDDFIPDN